MAEFMNYDVQNVEDNANVLFNTEWVGGTKCIMHRPNSGLVNLKGITNQCKARFKVTYNGDVAIATGGTAGVPLVLAIAVDGEPVTRMTTTTSVIGAFFNVSSSVFIDVPKCCCSKISIKNLSTQTVAVQNANILIERVA